METTIEFEGKRYTRRNSKWLDDNNKIVCKMMQDRLNKIHSESLDFSEMSVQSAIQNGDKYKQSSTYGLAIKCYEYALPKANWNNTAYILPRLSSCYRKQKMPWKAVGLLVFAEEYYGEEMITEVFLTSIAAAYCDLGEFDKAKLCCNKAFKLSGCVCSDELQAVYDRIKGCYK